MAFYIPAPPMFPCNQFPFPPTAIPMHYTRTTQTSRVEQLVCLCEIESLLTLSDNIKHDVCLIWQEILYIVTNLITPRAVFYYTFLLNLVQLEIAPFDPPTPKTLA